MEEALFVEKERAQVTLNCIGDAVVCTDIAGNITFLNRRRGEDDRLVVAGSGGPADGRGVPDPGRREPRRPSRIRWRWRSSADRTVHLPPNCILVRRDGVEIPIEDSVAPIHDREGQATGAVHRLPRRERGAGDGAADDPLGRSTTS